MLLRLFANLTDTAVEMFLDIHMHLGYVALQRLRVHNPVQVETGCFSEMKCFHLKQMPRMSIFPCQARTKNSVVLFTHVAKGQCRFVCLLGKATVPNLTGAGEPNRIKVNVIN